MTRTVRFQLDEDKKALPPEPTSLKRSVSDMLRLEDEGDTWF